MNPGHDALAAALEELKLRCVLMVDPPGARPWRRAFPLDALSLHVVLRGACVIDVDVHLWRHRLDDGELLVVNRGMRGALRPASESDPPEVLSARVQLEAPLGHPMLASFPRLIRTSAGTIPRSFSPSMHTLVEELARPTLGGRAVASRLCEILFVQALRAHVQEQSWTDRGWYRMLAGAPPSTLLRQARVRRAAELLRAGDADLSRVASEAGYGSRQALCRAFRRELGISPADHWRATHHRPFPRRKERPAPSGAEGHSPPPTSDTGSRAPVGDQAAATVAGSSRADSADSRFINGSSPKEMTAPATATAPSQK